MWRIQREAASSVIDVEHGIGLQSLQVVDGVLLQGFCQHRDPRFSLLRRWMVSPAADLTFPLRPSFQRRHVVVFVDLTLDAMDSIWKVFGPTLTFCGEAKEVQALSMLRPWRVAARR
jgi:hypothetical protein